MKKLFNLLLILLVSFGLASCQTPDNGGGTDDPEIGDKPQTPEKATPEFFGSLDVEVKLSYGEYYKPMNGVEVWANNSDISDMVIYTIYDKNDNDNEILEIPLSYGGTYEIKYYIPETKTIKKATFVRKLKVGTGIKDLDYDEDSLEYKLVWSDEFDGTTLNTKNWNYETGTGQGGWGNNELQYYTNSTKNVFVTDGKLHIKAIKESKGNCNYTSARITTKNKVDYKYGRFEASIKVPSGRGIWPAFWMMPTTSAYGIWPNSGEIDIMEHVGYNPGVIHSTIHCELYNGMAGTQRGGNKNLGNSIYNEFHVYAVEWFPDKMIFYVDDIEVFEYKPANKTQKTWPYDQKFFMILNVAVGGNWGGVQGVNDAIFPTEMVVDYVRVYQSEQLANFQ
jgi:beta-glucanase (GH16 family)